MKLKQNQIMPGIILLPTVIYIISFFLFELIFDHMRLSDNAMYTMALSPAYWNLSLIVTGYLSVRYLNASYKKIALIGILCGLGMVIAQSLPFAIKFGSDTFVEKFLLEVLYVFGFAFKALIPVCIGTIVGKIIGNIPKNSTPIEDKVIQTPQIIEPNIKLKNNLITLAIIVMPFILFNAWSFIIELVFGHLVLPKGEALRYVKYSLIYWTLIYMLVGFLSVKYLKASVRKVVFIGLLCGIGMVLYQVIPFIIKQGFKTLIETYSSGITGMFNLVLLMFNSVLLIMIPVFIGSLIARAIEKRTKSNA